MSTDGNILSNMTFSDLMSQKGINAARLLYAVRDQAFVMNTLDLQHLRTHLPTLLTYYNEQLDKTNSAIFAFLNEEKKQALINQLKFTYWLLYAQHQLDTAESRRYPLAGYETSMKKCAKLIDQLEITGAKITPETLLLSETTASEKYLKFCGMTIVAPYVVAKIMEFIDSGDKSLTIKQMMTDVNGVRLYWVWGGGLLSSVLDMLGTDFYNVSNAQQSLSYLSPITGYMSWLLYYARFGINLGLLLKHTIKGPWMDEEEAQIPAWERFKTQWNQRKFALLNDSIWATANMACFFWLRGSGILGYAGNILTAGLLLMDLTLTAWRFWEETTEHNKKVAAIQQALAMLNAELKTETEPAKILELEQKIAENEKLLDKTNFDWRYKKYSTINDLVYSAGLLVAFGLMCCFFFPPAMIAPATLAMIGLAGAALCFVLTVAYAAVAGGIEIAKSRESGKRAKAEYAVLLKQFNMENDEVVQKQLFLEMKQLAAESDYQHRMVRFQAIKLVNSVLIDAFVPAIVFATLVFMPLGVGLAVLAAAIALAICSKMLLKRFEPKAEELPVFDYKTSVEFAAFKENPNLTFFDNVERSKPGFFASAPSKTNGYLTLDYEDKLENDLGYYQSLPNN